MSGIFRVSINEQQRAALFPIVKLQTPWQRVFPVQKLVHCLSNSTTEVANSSPMCNASSVFTVFEPSVFVLEHKRGALSVNHTEDA